MPRGEPSAWDRVAVACWPKADHDQLDAWAGKPLKVGASSTSRWHRLGQQFRARPFSTSLSLIVCLGIAAAFLALVLFHASSLTTSAPGPWRYAGLALAVLVIAIGTIYAFRAREVDTALQLGVLRRERCRSVRAASPAQHVSGQTGEDLVARRRYWARRATRERVSAGMRLAWVFISATTVVAPAACDAITRNPDALRVLGYVGLYSLCGWLVVSGQRRARLAAQTLENVSCPSCGYDLRPPGGLGDLTLGVFVGPPRCPECGDRWPLVPPPVPASEQSKQRAP